MPTITLLQQVPYNLINTSMKEVLLIPKDYLLKGEVHAPLSHILQLEEQH